MNAANTNEPFCEGCRGPHTLTGVDELRKAVNVINGMRESFNDRFTIAQLVNLWRALHMCEWDIAPDEWSGRQVNEALRGIVPQFRESNGSAADRVRSLPMNGYVPVYTNPKRFKVTK